MTLYSRWMKCTSPKKGQQQIEDSFNIDSSHLISTVCSQYQQHEEKQTEKIQEFFDAEYWKIYVRNVGKRQPQNDLSRLIVSICQKNPDQSVIVLKYLLDLVIADDEFCYWKYFGIWKDLVLQECEDTDKQDQKINFTIKAFKNLFDRDVYYQHLENTVTFYLNLCTVSERLTKLSQTNGRIINEAKERIEQLSNPKWIQNKSKILKKRRFEVNQQRLVNGQATFDEKYKKRMHKLKAINSGDWESLKELSDKNILKDITTSELMTLSPGDELDYRISENVHVKVEVQDNLGEMIWIQIFINDTKTAPWIHYDSDRFAYKNTESEEQKYIVDFYQSEKFGR